MTAATTVRAFGAYLWVLGTLLLLFPSLVLSPFGLPVPDDVWIRVVGVLVINIGSYYWFGARDDQPRFLMATVYARIFVLAAFIGFVFAKLAPAMLIAFGVVDFIGALWTWFALRR
ncbi:MAG: hypothetical protein IPO66_04010 [Rhodanobacteraceae bacterium]|nr:hypothetical protein [Rhodanobacteraceae bacterium]